jgi:hypothetical protein
MRAVKVCDCLVLHYFSIALSVLSPVSYAQASRLSLRRLTGVVNAFIMENENGFIFYELRFKEQIEG